MRRPVAALVRGGLPLRSMTNIVQHGSRQVATDQSADRSAHSKGTHLKRVRHRTNPEPFAKVAQSNLRSSAEFDFDLPAWN